MASHLQAGKGLPRDSGFTYIGVLLAIALTSIGLTVVSELWSKTAERQKLAQLEWVGRQYVKAIESFYYANTGSVHYYPKSLDALLLDERHLSIKRHIRELYPNPITGKLDWVLLRAPDGGISGVGESLTRNESLASQRFVFIPRTHRQ